VYPGPVREGEAELPLIVDGLVRLQASSPPREASPGTYSDFHGTLALTAHDAAGGPGVVNVTANFQKACKTGSRG
jgi:hypothetical protein